MSTLELEAVAGALAQWPTAEAWAVAKDATHEALAYGRTIDGVFHIDLAVLDAS